MISAEKTLERLREGNARYVADAVVTATYGDARERTADGQQPFAAVLACADSRIPVEMVFDQGIGDLFVVRIAGNVVGRSEAASIEFAASYLGVRLVVVLGHTDCGAVSSVVEWLRDPVSETSASLGFFIEKIRPSVERVIDEVGESAPERVVEKAVRENVRHSVDALQAGSEVLRTLVENDGLQVVGAEYSLRTGTVDFF